MILTQKEFIRQQKSKILKTGKRKKDSAIGRQAQRAGAQREEKPAEPFPDISGNKKREVEVDFGRRHAR